jgi:hypothetical protein
MYPCKALKNLAYSTCDVIRNFNEILKKCYLQQETMQAIIFFF